MGRRRPSRPRAGRAVAPPAVLALVIAACSGCSSGANSGPVKIGFFGPLTGNNSPQLGIVVNNAVKLAVQQYDAKGQGPKVSLVEYDSQGDPAQAPQVAQRATTDHTVAVVGPQFSGESYVADPILQQAQIVNVTASATNTTLASHGWTYWHRAVGNDDSQGPAAANFIAHKLNLTRVAVIDDNSEYGAGIADIVASTLPKDGATVAVRDHIDPKATDYTAAVNATSAGNVQAVFYGGYYQQAGPLVKQLRAAGNNATFVSDDSTNDPGFVTSAGAAAANGSYVTCPCAPTPSTPAGQFFANAYQAANNSPPGNYSAQAYDATNFILAAVRAGNTSSTAINSYLASHSYTGIVGTLKFNARGEIDSPVVEAYQVQNGTINPIGPIS